MPSVTVLTQPDAQVWRLLNLLSSEPQSPPTPQLDAPAAEKKAESAALAVWLL